MARQFSVCARLSQPALFLSRDFLIVALEKLACRCTLSLQVMKKGPFLNHSKLVKGLVGGDEVAMSPFFFFFLGELLQKCC